MEFRHLLGGLLALAMVIFTRIYLILPRAGKTREYSKSGECCKLAVFLGSGGHTTEMLALVSSLDFDRYTPRTYIISEDDSLSERKVYSLETAKAAQSRLLEKDSEGTYAILTIPRARKVHQPLLTTPPTALVSFLKCLYYVTLRALLHYRAKDSNFADVLVLNGPGTCLTLCLAVYVNKFFSLPAPRVLYVESFARVQRLSVSGKLLEYLVDRFIVQWPQLLNKKGRGEYRGWLI